MYMTKRICHVTGKKFIEEILKCVPICPLLSLDIAQHDMAEYVL